MARLVEAYDNQNRAIAGVGNDTLRDSYFNLVRLEANAIHRETVEGFELVAVVLSGTCGIECGGEVFANVGARKDIWSGNADSVFAGLSREIEIKAGGGPVEVAIAGARCGEDHAPFRVKPEEVDEVVVGSLETHSRRAIRHILGNKHHGKVGRLLVSELYADGGCWSGYPPHKHDADAGEDETAHEEIYHYRYRPEHGFGAQVCYQADGSRGAFMLKSGDTFLLDQGYHPTVCAPGYDEYIFTILAGKTRRSLIQNFDVPHRWMMDRIPGIAAMREKFK